MPPDSPTVGIIYHLNPRYAELLRAEPDSNLRLDQLAGIRLGEARVIEPDIPDEDDRIHRQRALFVNGFWARDLEGIAIDRLYFRQNPQVVFEDPSLGFDEPGLLPDRTELTRLAKAVRRRFAGRKPSKVHPVIGQTMLSETGILGSRGSLLYSQLREGRALEGPNATFQPTFQQLPFQ